MNRSRRDLLKWGIGAAALGAAGVRPAGVLAGEPKKKIPIALQLYSVRDVCAKDLPGTLDAVAKMGYQGVEFAGYHGRTAAELRATLNRSGLACCSTHIELETLVGDAFPKTLEFHQMLGVKNIAIHGLRPKYLASVAMLLEASKLLNEAAEKLHEAGIRFSYHTKVRDVRFVEGQRPVEVALAHAGPRLLLQVDTSNCLDGGEDPVALFKRYPGRAVSIHLSEHRGPPHAVIGEGDVKWKDVFDACQSDGHVEWYVVEQVTFRNSSLESARLCLENLHKMGK